LVAEVKSLLGGSTWDRGFPTFFEVVTIMALRYFAELKCDLVVWETGLGGRLDATNIVTPLASVITNVQLDHQQWLGDTLPQIASEKAGIIKPRIPVMTSADGREALRVLQDKARKLHAPFTAVNHDDTRRPPLDALELPLLGEHQRLNAALALGVVRALAGKIAVSEQAIRTGLATVDWPGRFQLIRLENGKKIVLDGAHNPAGINSLCAALRKYFPGEKPTIIFGVLHDKDFATMCQLLAPQANRFCLSPVSSERSADPEMLRALCQAANPSADARVFSNPSDALQNALTDPFVLVTGSLHFIGETMELLRVSPSPPSNERGLNEWMGRP
jgi:dihydrofolate synthase / folylpolyglutamate synthase